MTAWLCNVYIVPAVHCTALYTCTVLFLCTSVQSCSCAHLYSPVPVYICTVFAQFPLWHLVTYILYTVLLYEEASWPVSGRQCCDKAGCSPHTPFKFTLFLFQRFVIIYKQVHTSILTWNLSHLFYKFSQKSIMLLTKIEIYW